jgi:rhodanese-related sulfurtransferase
VRVRYIVRRLTPTECARLQGFADRWGDIEEKTEFSDEEYRFWLEVRNTHATVIGGREAKEYTKEQMLKWYNSLHTDSAEYKMWGNGIALPPALYCMQGIREALDEYAEMPVAKPAPKADVVEVEEAEEPAVESVCEEEHTHEEEPVPTPIVDPEKERMRETLLDVAKVFGEMAAHILEVYK